MQGALPIVIVAVVGAAVFVGLAALLLSRGPYDRIGRSGLTFDGDGPRADADSSREEEIAQMLAASNARRAASGREPLERSDLHDPELRAEIRAFVEARNARRAERGLEPLDVDAEVDRRLSG